MVINYLDWLYELINIIQIINYQNKYYMINYLNKD